MSDLAKMTYAFSDALKISDPKELEEAFAIAATGAKLGSFELKDMAKSVTRYGEVFCRTGNLREKKRLHKLLPVWR